MTPVWGGVVVLAGSLAGCTEQHIRTLEGGLMACRVVLGAIEACHMLDAAPAAPPQHPRTALPIVECQP